MRKFVQILFLIVLLTTVTQFALHPIPVSSQTNEIQTSLNKTIQDMRNAELSGANPTEIEPLIDRLNSITQLQVELLNLPPQNTDQRMKILAQISDTLSAVDADANQIESTASQRTFLNHLVTYSSGIIGAALATLAYHCGVQLWRKYRIKRTFQMDIISK